MAPSALLLAVLVNLFLALASADELFSSTSGLAFGQSSREQKFKIEFHSAESSFHPDNELESIMMSNKEGRQYMCFLPVIEETRSVKSINQHNSSSIILETDRRQKLKTPDELIGGLQNCIYRHESWWTYEFCNQRTLRQIRLEDEKVVQEFVLGEFDPEATAAYNQNHSDISMLKDPRSKDASQRYHAHLYKNGTICDLTNQPRETEVRFVCSDHSVMIGSIKEISTCKYVVMVHFPMLCKHPMFQQERPSWHTIHCNEMPRDAAESTVEDGLKNNQITLIPEDDVSQRYAT